MKICTMCKEEKDESCYYVRKSGKLIGRLYARCKDCSTNVCKAYHEARKTDPDKTKAYKARQNARSKARSNKDISYRINAYKQGAKKRGFLWELTKEEAALFWEVPCEYCGNTINGLGIDRVDSSVGYILSNCVPCCTMCNIMKMAHSKDVWLDHIERIMKHQGRL